MTTVSPKTRITRRGFFERGAGAFQQVRGSGGRARVLSVNAVFVMYQSTSVEQTEEAISDRKSRSRNGVTSPQRDFV